LLDKSFSREILNESIVAPFKSARRAFGTVRSKSWAWAA
jgi:hypothetical protein